MQVAVKLSQSIVLTRAAFEATLELSNPSSQPLTHIQITLQIFDTQGNLTSDRFAFKETLLEVFQQASGREGGVIGRAIGAGHANE